MSSSSAGNDTATGLLESADIARVLSSKGPVVKCVVLRATPQTGTADGDKKPSAEPNNTEEARVIPELIDEIEIDTTPSKSMVSKTLGGSFTFLGQYEDEGVVLMIRNIPEDAAQFERKELASEKLSCLRSLCKERDTLNLTCFWMGFGRYRWVPVPPKCTCHLTWKGPVCSKLRIALPAFPGRLDQDFFYL